MADSAVDAKEVAPAVEKETVTSSVKESPVKETNGSEAAEEKPENGPVKNAKNGTPKENGTADNGEKDNEEEDDEEDEEEVKENGESDATAIKRKSCSGEAEAPDATTPEKKQKLVEADRVEDSEEAVED